MGRCENSTTCTPSPVPWHVCFCVRVLRTHDISCCTSLHTSLSQNTTGGKDAIVPRVPQCQGSGRLTLSFEVDRRLFDPRVWKVFDGIAKIQDKEARKEAMEAATQVQQVMMEGQIIASIREELLQSKVGTWELMDANMAVDVENKLLRIRLPLTPFVSGKVLSWVTDPRGAGGAPRPPSSCCRP